MDSFDKGSDKAYSSPEFLKDLGDFYNTSAYTLHFHDLFQEFIKRIESSLNSSEYQGNLVIYILKVLHYCMSIQWN